MIEDRVFVGSNMKFVTPVRIGRNVVVRAGSAITKDVPEGVLAVTRVVQKVLGGKSSVRNSRISRKQAGL